MATEKGIILVGHGSGFPSTKNMESYLTNRHKLIADNGKHKGLIAVRRLKGITDEERQKFHEAYKSILGRNYYSQDLREYVFTPYKGRYYSDCSSSGDACYKKAGHDVGWLNTAGIYESSKFESVPVIIKEGHVMNPEVLKECDALLFVGNDPRRPLQIGHVEFIYEIKREVGWHWVQSDGKWYYQDSEGRNTHGWKVVNHHWYAFDEKGAVRTGIFHEGADTYYLMESGDLEGACCKTDNRGNLEPWYVEDEP